MLLFLQLSLSIVLGIIFYQDLKYRAVTWVLFPILAILIGSLHFLEVFVYSFLYVLIFNFAFLTILISILFFYIKWIRKIDFKSSIGVGDLLFFIALGFGFPTATFIVLFVSSLLFSLLIYTLQNKNNGQVPLAGNMSVFILICLACHWFGLIDTLYKV